MARSAAALAYSSVRRCAFVCYRRRGNEVEVGHCGTAYLERNLHCIALAVLSCQLEVSQALQEVPPTARAFEADGARVRFDPAECRVPLTSQGVAGTVNGER